MGKRLNAIYQDQRIAEEFCNFKCDYCEGFCPSEYSLRKDEKGNLYVPNEWYEIINKLPEDVKRYFKDSRTIDDFYDLSYEIMKRTKNMVSTDILKISGGELTINKNLSEFVDKIHNNYLSVQILTNGLNLNEQEIEKYKEMGNISFQISVDGVTGETNYARTHNPKNTEKVLKNIDYMLELGLGVEINCVLTKYNTNNFLSFLERFKNANNFIVVPRPVRGEPKELLTFSKEQALRFEKTINDNFNRFEKILPPREYFNRLIYLMKNDKKNWNCYTPYYILSIDGYGNFEKCPCGLIDKNQKNIMNKNEKINDILMDSKYKVPNNYEKCKYCMTQYEIINLYIEGKITKEELKKVPSLSKEEIILHIDEIKEGIILKNIKESLEKEYNLCINNVKKNDESTDGNVYMIYTTDKVKYVVKIYKDLIHTKNMINLHKLLIENGLNVPKIIETTQNENYIKIINDNYLVVYSYMEGEPVGWSSKYSKLSNSMIENIATTINKLHTITNNNKFKFKDVPYINNNKDLYESVLHFDLTRNNIFFESGNVEVIDFDDAKYGPSICDISIIIANLFFSKSYGVDLEGVNSFINKYYENNPERKEKERPLIKKYAIEWIDYILDGNEFDTSTTESFGIKRELIKNNL